MSVAADERTICHHTATTILSSSSSYLPLRSSLVSGVTLASLGVRYNMLSDERLYICGYNRLGRALGGTGLVALADGFEVADSLRKPGYKRKIYRLGERRDSDPHEGDSGIPFPHVDLAQIDFNPILEALAAGEDIRAVIKPTAPNPFVEVLCGVWVPFRTPLIMGHAMLIERSTLFLSAHIKANGIRPDLAQTALLSEVVAHVFFGLNQVTTRDMLMRRSFTDPPCAHCPLLLLKLTLHLSHLSPQIDPFVSFYWGKIKLLSTCD